MAEKLNWEAPPLSTEDQRLIDAYVSVGRSVDDLPYTPEFDVLIRRLDVTDTLEKRHELFKRLLLLRKRGWLPRMELLNEA